MFQYILSFFFRQEEKVPPFRNMNFEVWIVTAEKNVHLYFTNTPKLNALRSAEQV